MQYAKGKSDVVAKLDGSYKMGAAGAGAAGGAGTGGGVTQGSGPTELQQQIFGGVPPSHSLPQKVVASDSLATSQDGMDVDAKQTADEPKGVKRGREEEDEESDEEAPMEEDSDASMEEGSDDDDD